MRVKFRQYAQQMGLQNYRTILDEQIDMLLDSSVHDTIDQILKEHIALTNDGAGETNSKLGQINAFRNLYKVEYLTLIKGDGAYDHDRYYAVIPANYYLYVDVDARIHYKPTGQAGYTNHRMVNVRVIDAQRLGNTFNDANQKPSLNSPIATIIGDEIDMYVGDLPRKGNGGDFAFDLLLHYIATPDSFAEIATDVEYTSLPDYLHENIIKHAIDLHRISVAGSLYSSQAQQSQNVNANRQQRASRAANED